MATRKTAKSDSTTPPPAKTVVAKTARAKTVSGKTAATLPVAAPSQAAPAKKAAVKKPAVKKVSVSTPAALPQISAQQRQHYVEVAAFYIAERRGFAPGNPAEDWRAAEEEISRLIATGHFSRD